MKQFTKQLQNATKDIVLSEHEREAMRDRLVAYMEYQPIRKKQRVQEKEMATSSHLFLPFFRMHHVSGALIIALIATTGMYGVSSASTQALPGDLLYPVKVDVREKIQGALLSTDEERAAWERERAERRLTEASQLAVLGRLNVDTKNEIRRRFAEHTEAVVTHVRSIEKTDPVLAAEAADEFETALDMHEAVLARVVVEQGTTVANDARDLVGDVRGASIEAAKVREDADQKINELVSSNTQESGASSTVPVPEPNTGTEWPSSTTDVETVATTTSVDTSMQEYAIQRAHDRAQQNLEKAQSMYAQLDSTSDTARTVGAGISEAANTFAEGEQMMKDAASAHGAYLLFRSVAHAMQGVAQLLETASQLPADVRSDVVRTAVTVVEQRADTDTRSIDVRAPEASMANDTTTPDEHASTSQGQLTTMLEQAQLQLQEVGTGTTKEVQSILNDAVAGKMRADIAFSMGEVEDAGTLYAQGVKNVQQALGMLQRPTDSDMSTASTAQTTDMGTSSLLDVPGAETLIIIRNEHQHGVERLIGTVTTSRPVCSPIDAVVRPSGTSSDRYELVLSTNDDDSAACDTTNESHSFSVAATSSVSGHAVEKVTWNGVEHSFHVATSSRPTE